MNLEPHFQLTNHALRLRIAGWINEVERELLREVSRLPDDTVYTSCDGTDGPAPGLQAQLSTVQTVASANLKRRRSLSSLPLSFSMDSPAVRPDNCPRERSSSPVCLSTAFNDSAIGGSPRKKRRTQSEHQHDSNQAAANLGLVDIPILRPRSESGAEVDIPSSYKHGIESISVAATSSMPFSHTLATSPTDDLSSVLMPTARSARSAPSRSSLPRSSSPIKATMRERRVNLGLTTFPKVFFGTVSVRKRFPASYPRLVQALLERFSPAYFPEGSIPLEVQESLQSNFPEQGWPQYLFRSGQDTDATGKLLNSHEFLVDIIAIFSMTLDALNADEVAWNPIVESTLNLALALTTPSLPSPTPAPINPLLRKVPAVATCPLLRLTSAQTKPLDTTLLPRPSTSNPSTAVAGAKVDYLIEFHPEHPLVAAFTAWYYPTGHPLTPTTPPTNPTPATTKPRSTTTTTNRSQRETYVSPVIDPFCGRSITFLPVEVKALVGGDYGEASYQGTLAAIACFQRLLTARQENGIQVALEQDQAVPFITVVGPTWSLHWVVRELQHTHEDGGGGGGGGGGRAAAQEAFRVVGPDVMGATNSVQGCFALVKALRLLFGFAGESSVSVAGSRASDGPRGYWEWAVASYGYDLGA